MAKFELVVWFHEPEEKRTRELSVCNSGDALDEFGRMRRKLSRLFADEPWSLFLMRDGYSTMEAVHIPE